MRYEHDPATGLLLPRRRHRAPDRRLLIAMQQVLLAYGAASGGAPPPSLATTATSGSQSTPVAPTMPSGITAGDLLVAVISVDGGNADDLLYADTSNWVRIVYLDKLTTLTDLSLIVLAKIAAGGDSLTLSASGGIDWSAVVLRFSAVGHIECSELQRDTSAVTSLDPPSLSPSPGNADYNAIAIAAFEATTQAFSGFPGGYGTAVETYPTSSSNSTSTGVAVAAVSGSSIDPGAFTMAAARRGIAATAAIYTPPASVSTPAVASIGKTTGAFSGTLTFTMPSGITAGDFLLAVMHDAGAGTEPAIDTGYSGSDWILLPNHASLDPSSTRRSFAVKPSASGSDALRMTGAGHWKSGVVFRITGGGSHLRMNNATGYISSSSSPAAPAFKPLPGSREYLVMALFSSLEQKTVNTYPAGYSGGDINYSHASNGNIAYCYKTETTDTVAAATFALAAAAAGRTDHIVLWGPGA